MLNVLLARPIFSPTDFIQIKGRGTRLFTFEHEATGRSAGKDGFALFDFFANCEFFEDEFDYDEELALPKGQKKGDGGNGGGGGGAPGPDSYTNTSADPISTVQTDPIGDDGMRIDREMYRQRFATQAQEAAACHPELRSAVETQDWPAAEALVSQLLMEKPEDFWNLVKLQKVFRSDRNPTLREILKVIFGLLPGVATREQLVVELFDRFVATQPVDATSIREMRQVFESFILDGEVRQYLDNREFGRLRARDTALAISVKTLGPERLQLLVDYIRAEIRLDDFADVA